MASVGGERDQEGVTVQGVLQHRGHELDFVRGVDGVEVNQQAVLSILLIVNFEDEVLVDLVAMDLDLHHPAVEASNTRQFSKLENVF